MSKEDCYKVFLCGHFQRKSCSYIIHHIAVRWIAGDVPIYIKVALTVTQPFRKRRSRQISLNSASAVRANERSSIITNRKSTMRFSSSHRWTLCVTLSIPKGGSKQEFLHLALPFISSLQVIVDTSNFVFDHSKSQPTDERKNVAEMGVVTVTWYLENGTR